MDWRHWASIARLSIRKMSRSNTCKKLRNAQKILRLHAVWYSYNLHLDPNDFLHEVQFSAAIEAAYFPADLRNAALSAFEEGAPFMGTALAEYEQCIGAEVVCHFHHTS